MLPFVLSLSKGKRKLPFEQVLIIILAVVALKAYYLRIIEKCGRIRPSTVV